MSKIKYRFNPESLNYYRVKATLGQKFWKFLSFLVGSLVISIIYYFVFASFIDLPKEKGLRRELSELKVNYKVFNQKLNGLEKVLEDMQVRDNNIYRTIFESEPIDENVREAGFGGTDRYEKYEKMSNGKLIANTAKRLDKILAKTYVQSKSYDELIEYAKNYKNEIASIPAIQPIANADLTRTASGYGYRIHPIYKIKKMHEGMDFTAPIGSDIYATGDGVIAEIEQSQRGYGNKIIIDHGFGYKTLYAHLNGFKVKVGQKVKRGDVIGYVGNTGLSTAPHLHYEVIHNRAKVNPINYYFNDLSTEEFDKMIEISQNMGQTFD